MNDYALTGLIWSPDEYMVAVENVSVASVARVASQIRGVPSIACIGPHKKQDFK